VRRALKTVGQKIMLLVDDPRALPIAKIADLAQHLVFEATAAPGVAEGPLPLIDLMQPALDFVEEVHDGGESRLATGLTDIDRLLNGLSPGELIVIGGRPGIGKTAVAMTFTRHVALRLGRPAVIFSKETKKVELALRISSAESGVPLHTLRSGMLNDDDWTALARTMPAIHTDPLYIDDRVYDFREIRAKTRRLRAQQDIRLVVVDCIQGFAHGGPDRYGEVSAVAHGLKALAMECNVPVLAVSQLNRAPEERTDKRPQMANLRDGGTIEDYADVVILVHRDDYYDSSSPRAGECDLIVAKYRNGPTDTVMVASQLHLAHVADWVDATDATNA
jgi:replicative DNA helicase